MNGMSETPWRLQWKIQLSVLRKGNLKDSGTYKQIWLSIHIGSPTEKIKLPYVETLGIHALLFPISCHVSLALCTECIFSLKEKTPPAANVRTSSPVTMRWPSTAACLEFSPGGGCGCWHSLLCIRSREHQQLGHFKDTA